MVAEIENFGRNIRFQPLERHVPKNVEDVLAILRANSGRRIRAIGRLHSWSELLRADEVLLDLRHLDDVQIDVRDSRSYVTVGSGCQIKRVIAALDAAGLALPSQGLITEQTVAGAMSTGTHGSGKHSLSHYAVEITVATYDSQTGEPTIKRICEGPELQAARCALGCMGIILSVTLPCLAQYNIEEHIRFHRSLERVLEAERDYVIQQFYLLPHSWTFMAQHRREVKARRSLLSFVFRVYWFFGVDVGLHLVLLLLTQVLRSRSLIRFFYRCVVPLTIVRGWKVVDKSQLVLTMEHELFRHIEIEVFVKRSQLDELLEFVRSVLTYCDGDSSAISVERWGQLKTIDLATALKELGGNYTHHYPICIRKVEPDDTLVSMASASSHDEPYYAVSFINYNRPQQRDQFLRFASLLARATALLYDARPHWGKVCPIDAKLAERLYPKLREFRSICETNDPQGVFRNAWINELIFKRAAVSTTNDH
jgi:L-gulono-1,4-lactone dehydrogenase